MLVRLLVDLMALVMVIVRVDMLDIILVDNLEHSLAASMAFLQLAEM